MTGLCYGDPKFYNDNNKTYFCINFCIYTKRYCDGTEQIQTGCLLKTQQYFLWIFSTLSLPWLYSVEWWDDRWVINWKGFDEITDSRIEVLSRKASVVSRPSAIRIGGVSKRVYSFTARPTAQLRRWRRWWHFMSRNLYEDQNNRHKLNEEYEESNKDEGRRREKEKGRMGEGNRKT